jgi:predicted AlkP superfamily pyrophosphatase or phosphodiesterase
LFRKAGAVFAWGRRVRYAVDCWVFYPLRCRLRCAPQFSGGAAMIRSCSTVLLVVATAAGSGSLAAEETKTPTRRVLIVGIDGVRPDAMAAAKTPNLDHLRREGVYCTKTDIVAPRPTKSDTISGPGWSSILTGVWSDKHGVLDNKFQGSNYEEFPHFFVRLKAAQPSAYTVSLDSWTPIKENIVAAADVAETNAANDDSADETIRERAKEILARSNPTAMFVYFHQVDTAGHRHGFHPSARQYIRGIENVDRHVGEVMKAVAARKQAGEEEWLTIVCTDHGGRGTGHSGGQNLPETRNVFLIVHGRNADKKAADRPTYLVDVAVTALDHLNVTIDPRWKLDGKSLILRPNAEKKASK